MGPSPGPAFWDTPRASARRTRCADQGADAGILIGVVDDAENPRKYFRSRGFDVGVEVRDLHAEFIEMGQPGRASFFVKGRQYFCVDLMREGEIVARGYAHSETEDDALVKARSRYGIEQA